MSNKFTVASIQRIALMTSNIPVSRLNSAQNTHFLCQEINFPSL